MAHRMDRCPYCNSDCPGLTEHHGNMGCIYCHCMHTAEDVIDHLRPPSYGIIALVI